MGHSSAHKPRKRFGQHFLHDSSVVARIIAAINPLTGDHIVEIGPGLGVLTSALMEHVPEMDAVELDRDIIPRLAERCGPLGRLNIHTADALRFDFKSLAGDGRQLRIVGNLPYNISTPLMFHLLESRQVIKDMHFMLQKEVVDRLAAQPGCKDYGRLSVMMQYHCMVESLFNVPPDAFNPPPKVDSSIVRLIPYEQPVVNVDNVQALETIVTAAFSQRRKTLRNTLRNYLTVEQIEAQDIEPGCRAESLNLSEFARLANVYSQAIEDH
ncbi:16S rRNA (adenine(1518)-N(6)/adenine(1519)-N(6))-dimethyltransferase RsmA [Kaarinaea lacus]